MFIETLPALLHARACLVRHIDCDDLIQAVSCLSGISLEALFDKGSSIPPQILRDMRVPLAKWRHNLPELGHGRSFRKGRFKLGYNGLDASSSSTEPESSYESEERLPYWARIDIKGLRLSLPGDRQRLTEHEIALLLSDLSNSRSLIGLLSQINVDVAITNSRQGKLVNRARLGRLLYPAIQTAAKQGLIKTADDRSHRPATVVELLSLYAGDKIKPSMFDLILTASIANTGTQDVSLVPASLIKRFLDGDADQTELGLLAHQYFRPTSAMGTSSSSKTVLFRDPREGTTSIAICETTTSKTIDGIFRVKCEVVLCCALGNSVDLTTPSADFTDFQNRTQMLLEALFPSHTVPWAWWRCSAHDLDPGGQSVDQHGRNADWALRTSVLLNAEGTTDDPALQLLDLLFNLFTPARLNYISKILGYDSFLSTEVDNLDASRATSDSKSVAGSDEEEVNFELWVRPIQVMKVRMTVARQLIRALYERIATNNLPTVTQPHRPGISKHTRDVENASEANEYDPAASDDGAEEDSILDINDLRFHHRNIFRLGNGSKVQAEETNESPNFDFTTLVLNNDDVQDDVKVQARINFLLRPEIARCYRYTAEVDAVIETATPALPEQPVFCDNVEQILHRYRCRWDALLRANARLALSLTQREAVDIGISIEWYRWTVANAKKADRDRLVQRFLHFGNHPPDVQMVLGQDCWTLQLFKMLLPVDLGDHAYDGQLFNTSYLGTIQFCGGDPHMEQYYGSATGLLGEASRLSAHEKFLVKTPVEMSNLRKRPTSGALYFHEVGVTPGAQHSFHSLFRFPKVPQNRAASIHSRLLAHATEQFNIVSAGKLNHFYIRRNTHYIRYSTSLMDYFKSQVNLPRREPGQEIGVLNRVLPMTQGHTPYFSNMDLADSDLTGNHLCDRIDTLLETFYVRTSRQQLSCDDILQLLGELGGSYPDPHGGMVKLFRARYENVLAAHGKTYQRSYDDLTIPAVAGVLRYAFSEGFASEPCTTNNKALSFCNIDTLYFDWQKVAFEVQKLLDPNLWYYCTPEAVRNIWVSGFRQVGGISRQALIVRNARFLRGPFSGNTEEILFAPHAQLKPVMRERLRQLCRYQLHEYISGDQTFEDPEVELEKGVPLSKRITHNRAQRLVGGLLELVTSKLVDGLRKDRRVYISEASIRNCSYLMSYIETLLRNLIQALCMGLVSSKA
ncbi:hypothetical protein HC256_001414 [Beauveria bassiana]|nr:hypothetical protein HC256_001414 [Beauveria bassiana]KAH8721047.1 hypothetical protein HC256_001414 [Beauveria bassiana]